MLNIKKISFYTDQVYSRHSQAFRFAEISKQVIDDLIFLSWLWNISPTLKHLENIFALFPEITSLKNVMGTIITAFSMFSKML